MTFNESNTVEAFIRDQLCGGVTHHTAVGPAVARRNREVNGLGWHYLSAANLPRQPHDLQTRAAVADEQAHAVQAVRAAEQPHLPIEVGQALVNELHPPVGARQRVEDVGVEDERAPDPSRRPQGVIQRGVIVHAQVAAKPHERAVQGLVHGP